MSAKPGSSMQNQAYQFIRQKIALCEFAPNQMISESQLQEELGFSRTPVREAIGRLAQEGLLKVFPKRGIMVSGISISDIHQIFEVRLLVEPYVIRTCHSELDLDEISRFSQIFHAHVSGENQVSDFYALDDEFHSYLISGLKNDYLLDLYDRIRTQNIRLRIMSGQFIQSRLDQTMLEHAQIADSCLAQNWEQAALAMTEHLRYSKESSLATILQNSAPDIF